MPRREEQEYNVKSIAIEQEVWSTGMPRDEAKALLAFAARSGETLSDVIALVGLNPREMRELLTFVEQNPHTASGVERALHFRVRVADELESLTRTRMR